MVAKDAHLDNLTEAAAWEKLETLKSVDSYRRGLRASVRGLWAGQINWADFVDSMYSAVRRHFNEAWRAGAAEVGVQPSDITEEEMKLLETEITKELTFVLRFADDIEENNKASGGALAPLMNRVELWVKGFDRIYEMSKVTSAGDQKLMWVWDESVEQHCEDCRKLNGRVYRASVWRKYEIAPRSANLQCTQWGCQCQFVPTNEPVTKGKPPRLTGLRSADDHQHEHEAEASKDTVLEQSDEPVQSNG